MVCSVLLDYSVYRHTVLRATHCEQEPIYHIGFVFALRFICSRDDYQLPLSRASTEKLAITESQVSKYQCSSILVQNTSDIDIWCRMLEV